VWKGKAQTARRRVPVIGSARDQVNPSAERGAIQRTGEAPEPKWHNIVVFGKLAETCAKYPGVCT
jgi:single-stranded DNA-binding protein